MPTTRPHISNDEGILVEPEYTSDASAEVEHDGELSDLDLEEVLGGLERIHFPDPSETGL
jgi:hypothetical protein